MRHFVLAMCLVYLVSSWPTRMCHADDALQSELGWPASDFAKIIDKFGGASVAVGEFSRAVQLM
ncbi:hypothetical protein SH661x_002339 [Planctomicrobium sp. SH661]|uniref:hypothetical protein n=1 Tax=Planctomicrobium sp. SH661 TaxID=3448124 RepID=UPI003F5B27CE